MVTAAEIVDAARLLKGAYYRWWYVGASLPMFGEYAPTAEYIVSDPGVGVMCADLLDWARMYCGLLPLRGTSGYAESLVGVTAFDPDVPGVAGAVALKPYYSPYSQGHVALYTGEGNGHQLIQSLVNPGVTENYTDYETYQWAGCDFDYYGFMPDVDYSGKGGEDGSRQPESTAWRWLAIDSEGWARFDGPDWSRGWYDTQWQWHRPDDAGQ